MKIKVFVGIALALFAIIVASVGTAGLILYQQKKDNAVSQKLASTDPSITDNNPSVQSDSELGGITAEAVANHGSESDCWMIIDGNVYDFTKFLNMHPGAAGPMLPYCGKDGTNAYASKDKNPPSPHSQIAKDLLNQYFLGKLGSGRSDLAQNPGSGGSNVPTATNRPTITSVPGVTNNNNSSSVLTTADVATHSTPSNCWIIISGNVYAVTNYLNSHPGGSGVIAAYCGRDATNAFNTKDRNPGSAHSSFAVSQLGAYLVGRIGSLVTGNAGSTGVVATFTPTPTVRINTPTPTTTQGGGGGGGGGGSVTLTASQIATHNTLQDCWMIISNRVYNLTAYISQHPGGQSVILNSCGRDGSTAFQTRGGSGSHSSFAQNLLNNYYIGDLGASVPVGSTPSPTPAGSTATPTQSGSSSQLPASVLQRYPDATLRGNISYEDNGRMEFKINTGGQCRDMKVNSSGAISEDKRC